MKTWMETHGTIAAAVAIAAVLTLIFGVMAFQALLGAVDPSRLGDEFTRGALAIGSNGGASGNGGAARNASAIIAIVFGIIVIIAAFITVGLAFRRDWAREAGVVIFGLLGIVSIAASGAGLMSNPPAPSAWLGIFTGLVNLAVVAFLLAPATSRDFGSVHANRARRSF
ncbi:MAG: hypothetical protein ABFR53_12470 [Actinomycetota bacterium]